MPCEIGSDFRTLQVEPLLVLNVERFIRTIHQVLKVSSRSLHHLLVLFFYDYAGGPKFRTIEPGTLLDQEPFTTWIRRRGYGERRLPKKFGAWISCLTRADNR